VRVLCDVGSDSLCVDTFRFSVLDVQPCPVFLLKIRHDGNALVKSGGWESRNAQHGERRERDGQGAVGEGEEKVRLKRSNCLPGRAGSGTYWTPPS